MTVADRPDDRRRPARPAPRPSAGLVAEAVVAAYLHDLSGGRPRRPARSAEQRRGSSGTALHGAHRRPSLRGGGMGEVASLR